VKYMLLIYAAGTDRPDFTPEQYQAAIGAWRGYQAEASAAGVLVANNTLHPVSDATTVRVRDGQTLISDGPFAETHEQLGGYFVLECADLDEAMLWAQKMPGARYGSVEVRPVVDYGAE
jgi:hypothetical protein